MAMVHFDLRAATPEPEAEPEVSVVVPLFNERENVARLYQRLSAALGASGSSYEIVLVDDGSRDETPRLIDRLATQDPHVAVVHLSRNFGHQAAVTAGLDHARGRAVMVMDGDLQDPPEVIPQFIARWREGFDVVYAVRRRRKEGPFKRLAYYAFYRLLGLIAELDIPLDAGDFCLMDRRVVDAMRSLPERKRFVRGLRAFVGFRQTGLAYERAARDSGSPKYTLRALVGLATDGLISFSAAPLRLITRMGLASAATALGLAAWVVHDAYTHGSAPKGWASTIVIVLFMGSLQMISLGVIGEYVRLIFQECKGRPTYVVGAYRPALATERAGVADKARRVASGRFEA